MSNGVRAAPPSALVAAPSEPSAGACGATERGAGELTAAARRTVRPRAIVGAAGPTGVVCRTVVVLRADVADVAAARRAGDVTVVVEAPALDDDGAIVEVEPAVAVVPAPAVDGSTSPHTTPAATDPAANDISRRRCAAARPVARSGRCVDVGGASRSSSSGPDELRSPKAADDMGSMGTGTPWDSMQAQTPSQGPVPTASPQPRVLPFDVPRVPGPSTARLSDTPSTSRGTRSCRAACPAGAQGGRPGRTCHPRRSSGGITMRCDRRGSGLRPAGRPRDARRGARGDGLGPRHVTPLTS